MKMKKRCYIKWARPYYRYRDAKAMTRKRAIKIIMAATCYGNKRWANDAFDAAKRTLAGNPSNADVCSRVICYIYNVTAEYPPSIQPMGLRAYSIAKRLMELYGDDVGGAFIEDGIEDAESDNGFSSTGR